MKKAAGFLAALLVYGLAQGAAAADAARRTLTPDDFYRMQSVSDPQVSPDGQWVAYLVTTNDRDADESRTAVWMVSWDGRQQIPLTNPAHDTEAPRWSGDGRYVSFLSLPAGADKDQILLLDRRGGEARTLTHVSGDIEGYEWSPDGKRLVIVMEQSATDVAKQAGGGDAAKGGSDSGKDAIPKPIVIEAMHFKEDKDGYLGVGRPRHLYLFDVETRKLEPLTSDAAFNDDLPAWSADGKRIAFVRTRERGTDVDGMQDIEVIDAQPGAAPSRVLRVYVPNQQKLMWTADGKQILFRQGLEPRYSQYIQDKLILVAAAGGAPRPVTPALDRAVTSSVFAADGSLIATIEDDGIVYPARIELRNGAVTRLATGDFVVSDVVAGGGHAALLYSDDRSPVELFALEGGSLRKLTHHTDALMAELQLGEVQDMRFKSRDGTAIHGLLVKPPGYAPGRRYPAVLWIHGGPDLQDQHSFSFDDYQFKRQLLAAQGVVAFGINYRGSSGRGDAFSRAIFADWGHKEVEDLTAGVDDLIARGLADPARLGIGGWSYGGILTDYMIATTPRFKAAISGAGMANPLASYGTDEYSIQYVHELGAPWQNSAVYLKLAYPFLHADRIRTPTLFMGGDRDFNVPIGGGEQMYQALKTLGVPAQLIVYPGQYHTLTRPSFLKDRAERMAGWYGRLVQGQPGQ